MTNFQFLGVSSQAEDEEEEDQPLSLSWPESNRKRFTYLLIIPIVLPLWLTLPDVRKTVRDAELVPLTTTQNKIVMCFFLCILRVCDIHKLLSLILALSVFKEVLPRHLPGCHLLDRVLLLPDGVVGSPGIYTFYQRFLPSPGCDSVRIMKRCVITTAASRTLYNPNICIIPVNRTNTTKARRTRLFSPFLILDI